MDSKEKVGKWLGDEQITIKDINDDGTLKKICLKDLNYSGKKVCLIAETATGFVWRSSNNRLFETDICLLKKDGVHRKFSHPKLKSNTHSKRAGGSANKYKVGDLIYCFKIHSDNKVLVAKITAITRGTAHCVTIQGDKTKFKALFHMIKTPEESKILMDKLCEDYSKSTLINYDPLNQPLLERNNDEKRSH